MPSGLERAAAAEGPVVSGFSPAGFVVEGVAYKSVLLTPERAVAWDPPHEIGVDAWAPLLALQPPPEFILLGTGPILTFPPRSFVQALEAKGIGIEAMDSRAAARTWALLRSEHRWIGAALLPL